MSTDPAHHGGTPPPPDGPNLSRQGKWGVAPSTSPLMSRPHKFNPRHTIVGISVAVLVVVALIVLLAVF
ncbi:hypothetical protein [Mycobacterium camsae]|uniref:hypothetical protein n=1 Tax=Mycobacterium gordonae TaxID=1778 RepID=UPI00197D539F|nr:hypothetical protein [Mycobacterium gordonae]